MPAKPRWLLAIPDAIQQIEALDQDLLRTQAAFRREATRRDRVVTAIRQARLTGIRVAVPSEARAARLSGLPDGVSVEPGRIEVRFSSAQDAVGRLFALAQALTHDYEQFEALVEEGEAAGGGGEVSE